MESSNLEGTESPEALSSPPPIPPAIVPVRLDSEVRLEPVTKVSKTKRLPLAGTGMGRKVQPIQLLTNHIKNSVLYEDGHPTERKGTGRRMMDRFHETFDSELDGKDLAYDGEKSLFTVGALPTN